MTERLQAWWGCFTPEEQETIATYVVEAVLLFFLIGGGWLLCWLILTLGVHHLLASIMCLLVGTMVGVFGSGIVVAAGRRRESIRQRTVRQLGEAQGVR